MIRLATALSILILAALSTSAAELSPSFPNYALTVAPSPESRAAVMQGDPTLPFTWDQVAVVLESSTDNGVFRGFDPQYNPLQINVLPTTPTYLTVTGFDGNFGIQAVHVLAKTGGNSEVFQFTAQARGLVTDPANFTYDIRIPNSRIRVAPAVAQSANRFVRPGQMVKYTWSPTTQSERFPKCEAELSGRTAQATGLSTSVITAVLGVKVRPVVLGHYLMLVTPRDVLGEPPRGSCGNGLVFQCVFGTNYLAPVTDGFSADAFTPAINQTVTLAPNATDPQTGQSVFDNQTYEFGDGVVMTGVSGTTTHAYTTPGIYRVRCTMSVSPDPSTTVTATAEDSLVVGATILPRLAFSYIKEIPPEEAGDGLNQMDKINAAFHDPSGIRAQPGDRLIFLYNRNHFGRVSPSDNADDTDIVLKGGQFSGKTRIANNITIKASGTSYSVAVVHAQLDRTGDPRLGASYLKGVYLSQRIALCIIPADHSTPRVLLYTGNMQGRVKNGVGGRFQFVPETNIAGMATLNVPNPRTQQP